MRYFLINPAKPLQDIFVYGNFENIELLKKNSNE